MLGFLIVLTAMLGVPAYANTIATNTAVFYRFNLIRHSLMIVGLAAAVAGFALSPGVTSGVFVALSVGAAVLILFVVDPVRAIPSLTDPPRSPQPTADPDATVLALEYNGEAAAWPLILVVAHHLINDEVGGQPVVVTWCAACLSGAVFTAEARGQRLTFEVAGVSRRNMVIRDRQTRSIWQQDTGECLSGPLQGERLALLPAEQLTWGAWQAEHAAPALAAEPDPPVRGLMDNEGMYRMFQQTRHFMLRGHHRLDPRLDPHTEVVGIEHRGLSAAYPLDALRRMGTLHDQLGEDALTLTYDAASDRVRASLADGTPLIVRREWWLGWYDFHPGTQLYERQPKA